MTGFQQNNLQGNATMYQQNGANSTMSAGGGQPDGAALAAAVTELRDFIAALQRAGAVSADGTVTEPASVVQAVEEHRGRLSALAAAVGGGAKEAVLKAVQGGVAALVVGLLGGH
jgi:hypothetical protein